MRGDCVGGSGGGLATRRRMASCPTSEHTSERGVTLVELLISITLVAALAVGMLMAIRSGLTVMDRINVRLEQNRRVMGIQQIVSSQIGGAMPVSGGCRLIGTSESLQLVTSYSVGEGARGYPRMVMFSVARDPAGGVQLQEVESPYTRSGGCGVVEPNPGLQAFFSQFGAAQNPGAQNQAAKAPADQPVIPTPTGPILVLASRLYSCRFSYRPPQRPDGTFLNTWADSWKLPVLPGAIRIETVPLDGVTSNLPALAVNAPIHITKLQMDYVDDYQ
jgi:hypothetical protein